MYVISTPAHSTAGDETNRGRWNPGLRKGRWVGLVGWMFFRPGSKGTTGEPGISLLDTFVDICIQTLEALAGHSDHISSVNCCYRFEYADVCQPGVSRNITNQFRFKQPQIWCRRRSVFTWRDSKWRHLVSPLRKCITTLLICI